MAKDSGSRGQRVGYIRVSTVEQNNQRQKELLNASGRIDRFFEDKISGRTKTSRPGLVECMAYVRDGDELVVSSIDRLARSLKDLQDLVHELKGRGVALRATFVVDPEGIIRHVSANDLSVGRNVKEVLRTLDAFQTDELCPCNWQKGEETLTSKLQKAG